MSARAAFAFGAIVVGVVLPACRRPASLPGSFHTGIPVYAPSNLVDRGGFITGNPSGQRFDGSYWELSTPDLPDKVRHFYEAALPDGWRWMTAEADDGSKPDDADEEIWQFLMAPAGAAEGESVTIAIYKAPQEGRTKIMISEVLEKGKR
jgi:hypothetical protein